MWFLNLAVIFRVQIASLCRQLSDGVSPCCYAPNTAQTTTNQGGVIMSTEACHNCEALYFSNIWEVKKSVRRRGRIINKHKQRTKRKKRAKDRQRYRGRLGPTCSLSNPKSKKDCQAQREKERRQLVPTLTRVMAPKWSSLKPAGRQEQPRKQSA